MEGYSDISRKYLQYQKKRTILTILGVMLSSGLLFIILTLYFSYFFQSRDAVRAEADYEMVFFPEDTVAVEEIVHQDYVKNAYRGKYYDEFTNTYIEDAVYVNVQNPYKINTYFKQISESYGIKGEVNEQLAQYYLQGDIGNLVLIFFFMFLFFSFVFAIIGVGIIRNTIQLNTIEQIRDYGVMRCIGATRAQLQSVIFRMGFMQELTGMALGFVVGYPIAAIIGHFLHIKAGIHAIAVLYVLIVFLADLYFVMQENCKAVRKISPVEAVRDNWNKLGRRQKVKRNRKNLFGLLFGVDGDYAYKSLMANKGRFFKSVASFALGIAAFVGVATLLQSMKLATKLVYDTVGEYQVYFYEPISEDKDVDTAKGALPDEALLREIAKDSAVIRTKSMYASVFYAADREDFLSHYESAFLNETYEGTAIQNAVKSNKDEAIKLCSSLLVYGCDEEEYQWYENSLVDGTLDVSEHGIILVQTCRTNKKTDDTDNYEVTDMTVYDYQVTDYEVGDEITFLSGKGTETYVVEGIVREEKDNLYAPGFVKAIVPLKRYFAMTGLSDGDATGIKYKINMKDIDSAFVERLNLAEYDSDSVNSYVISTIQEIQSSQKMAAYVGMFVLFLLVMSSLNIINTTASNLHLRRLEFAQLRVIGVSVKRLRRMVMLEGVITTLVANIIGDALGFAVIAPMFKPMNVMLGIRFSYPIIAVVVGLMISLTIFCSSVYIPMRRMGQGVIPNSE